ncbi:MAG: SDR family NAD(P)-dependent oxidoreductase [Nevskiales bacterium]
MSRNRISRHASAVVTGAGSGIGRSFALEIARRGGRVVCADINEFAAQETVKQIKARRGEAWAVACDVGSADAVEKLAKTAKQKLGCTPDLVINNAGIGTGGSNIGDCSLDDWRATVDVNMWGVIHGCHFFTNSMREQGYGGIINVCSTASFAAAPKMGAYNTTKAAVLALSETLAAELHGSGVHVTALCPTFVKTNIVRDGRISGQSSKLGELAMAWTGVSPDKVVRKTLNALDRNQLYVLPQLDARTVWRLKRFTPVSYTRGTGVIARVMDRLMGADNSASAYDAPVEVPKSRGKAA